MEFLNDLFNEVMDITLVVATRLGEIPSMVVLLFVAVVVTVVFGIKRMVGKARGSKEPLKKRYLTSLGISLAVFAALHMIQRTELLLRESRELQYYVRKNAVLNSSEIEVGEESTSALDQPFLRQALPSLLGVPVEFSSKRLAPGIEFASFHSRGSSPLSGYVALVGLLDPSLKIEIGGETGFKSLTSAFGTERDCVVAINGEAGISPARNAPLGAYSGFCMINGERLDLAVDQWKPFLCFNKENLGWYVSAKDSQEEPSPAVYNAIWGRGDLLVAGEYIPEQSSRWNRASPRTLMGLNHDGTQLILLVLDGRQIGYSVGADHKTSADLMKLFGATNAMWCDQGGSSSMFVKNISSIVNRPSDGKERPVYTHFGISRR